MAIIIGGLLVGFGTRMGSGCTTALILGIWNPILFMVAFIVGSLAYNGTQIKEF